MQRALFFTAVLLLMSCSKPNSDLEPLWKEGDPKLVWAKCIFELDKIEAIRGRNLDDLNKGIGVARNQFMMDCFANYSAAPSLEHISNMSDYKVRADKRVAGDVSLNNGDR